MNNVAFLGIDCGVRGSICMITQGSVDYHKMPNTDSDYDDCRSILKIILNYKKQCKLLGLDLHCIVEEVNGRAGDNTFAIGKLLKNRGWVEMALAANGIKPLYLYPVSWKSALKLMLKKQKGVKVTDSMKKQKTVKFLKEKYTGLKITVQCCDSIAIAHLGFGWSQGDILLSRKNDNLFRKHFDISK